MGFCLSQVTIVNYTHLPFHHMPSYCFGDEQEEGGREAERDGKREKERHIFPIAWFIPQMPVTARSGLELKPGAFLLISFFSFPFPFSFLSFLSHLPFFLPFLLPSLPLFLCFFLNLNDIKLELPLFISIFILVVKFDLFLFGVQKS